MTDSDRAAFAEAIHMLGETFNEHVSDVRAEGYFDALRDFTMGEVNTAVRLALRTSKFFPRPVEIRELITGDAETNADVGWSSLLKEVRRVGYMGVPMFDDPRVLPTIKTVWGTWQRLCETLPGDGPELVGWIKQFKGAYRSVDLLATHEQLTAGMPAALKKSIAELAKAKTMPGKRMRLVPAHVGEEDTAI